MKRAFRFLTLVSLALVISACSVLPQRGNESKGQKLDPWESWNRKVFSFNEELDDHVLRPVATAYSEIVPAFVRKSIDNFMSNVGDAWSAVNLPLQGRPKLALNQGLRFSINTVLGMGGVLDIASETGLERNSQDLGQTFGRWGFGTGAYVVWPLFGPSSVRDSLALPWDRLASPAWVFDDGRAKVAITLTQIVNTRANFLRASDMLSDIALDKYTFYRDAYLQRRGHFEDDEEAELLVAPEPSAPASGAASAAVAASAPEAAASYPEAAASAPQ